jgi:hypothetical protein
VRRAQDCEPQRDEKIGRTMVDAALPVKQRSAADYPHAQPVLVAEKTFMHFLVAKSETLR